MLARRSQLVLATFLLGACNTPHLEYNPPPKIPEGRKTPRIELTNLAAKPADKQEARLRRDRDITYNKSNSRRHLFGGLGGFTIVDLVHYDRDFALSPTVVLAEVTRTQSYLSQDHLNLYTEWTAQVREILAQTGARNLKEQEIIAINRVGGALRMPSGQTYEMTISGIANPLVTGGTYMLFLTYDSCCDWFELDKAWLVQNGRMQFVDDWDENSSYQGTTLAEYRQSYLKYRLASTGIGPPGG